MTWICIFITKSRQAVHYCKWKYRDICHDYHQTPPLAKLFLQHRSYGNHDRPSELKKVATPTRTVRSLNSTWVLRSNSLRGTQLIEWLARSCTQRRSITLSEAGLVIQMCLATAIATAITRRTIRIARVAWPAARAGAWPITRVARHPELLLGFRKTYRGIYCEIFERRLDKPLYILSIVYWTRTCWTFEVW